MSISLGVVVFYFSVILSLLKIYKGKYLKRIPYIIVFVFMAIRLDYGDGYDYRLLYHFINSGMIDNSIEPLFVALNKIVPSFQFLIVLTSAAYVAVFYIVLSNSVPLEKRLFAFMIWILNPYVLMVDMSAIRQSMAIVLVMLGVFLANRFRLMYFIPLCLIATLFHKSAIILLLCIPWLNNKKLSILTKCIVLSSTLFLLLYPEVLIKLIEGLLLATNLNTVNYIAYLYNNNTNSILAGLFSVIVLLFLLVFGDNVDKQSYIYVKLSIIAMILEALQVSVQQLGRMAMYFMPYMVVSIPIILKDHLKINVLGRILGFTESTKLIIELLFVLAYLWKLSNFMTTQFAYETIF